MVFFYRNIFHIKKKDERRGLSCVHLTVLLNLLEDNTQVKARRMLHLRDKLYEIAKELVGKSFSSFCASSLQDLSSVCGFHTLTEAVLLFPLTLFGLIGSKHIGHLRFKIHCAWHVERSRCLRICLHRNHHYILFKAACQDYFYFLHFINIFSALFLTVNENFLLIF
jgi:hypothetical protein